MRKYIALLAAALLVGALSLADGFASASETLFRATESPATVEVTGGTQTITTGTFTIACSGISMTDKAQTFPTGTLHDEVVLGKSGECTGKFGGMSVAPKFKCEEIIVGSDGKWIGKKCVVELSAVPGCIVKLGEGGSSGVSFTNLETSPKTVEAKAELKIPYESKGCPGVEAKGEGKYVGTMTAKGKSPKTGELVGLEVK